MGFRSPPLQEKGKNMCKYCDGSWPRVSNNDFYLNADDQELWYDNDYDSAVEVNISFCPLGTAEHGQKILPRRASVVKYFF